MDATKSTTDIPQQELINYFLIKPLYHLKKPLTNTYDTYCICLYIYNSSTRL